MGKLILSGSFESLLEKLSNESKVAEMLTSSHYTTDAFCNYITMRGHMITYCPAKKEQLFNDDGTWKRECRQEGRPAKIARSLFKPEALSLLTDKDFELFANKMKATEISRIGVFQIVDGEAIRDWYHEQTYEPSQAALSESCMRYIHTQDFLDIYVENPKQIKMLIFTNATNKLLGRALLWFYENNIHMDRIYGHDATVEAFREYADDHGFFWRKYNNRTDEYYFVKHGETHDFRISIVMDHIRFDNYPYMDTFKYLNLAKKSIANNSKDPYDYELTSTEGNRHPGMPYVDENEDDDDSNEDNEPNYVMCAVSGVEMLEDDGCYVRGTGYVHPDLAVRNSIDRNWILRTDAVTTHIDNHICHISYTRVVEGNRYYVNSEHIVLISDETYVLKEKCVKIYDGRYLLKEDAVYCKYYMLYVPKNIGTLVECGDEYGYVVNSSVADFLAKYPKWKVSTTLINN